MTELSITYCIISNSLLKTRKLCSFKTHLKLFVILCEVYVCFIDFSNSLTVGGVCKLLTSLPTMQLLRSIIGRHLIQFLFCTEKQNTLTHNVGRLGQCLFLSLSVPGHYSHGSSFN